MTTDPELHGAVMALTFSFSMVHLADPFLTESLQTAWVFQQVPWWLDRSSTFCCSGDGISGDIAILSHLSLSSLRS